MKGLELFFDAFDDAQGLPPHDRFVCFSIVFQLKKFVCDINRGKDDQL